MKKHKQIDAQYEAWKKLRNEWPINPVTKIIPNKKKNHKSSKIDFIKEF